MRIIIIILLFAFSSWSATITLDSLLRRSNVAKVEAQRLPGFVQQPALMPIIPPERVHLTPPDSLFGHASNVSERIAKLETSVVKISAILDNIQSQAESNTKNLDLTVKILQLVSGIIGALVALIGSIYGIMKLAKGKM